MGALGNILRKEIICLIKVGSLAMQHGAFHNEDTTILLDLHI